MTDNLKDLEKKIHEARYGKTPSDEEALRIKKAQNSKMAMQAGYEFVASVMLSAVLGYFIDKWLGTAPLFLISLFLLGTCAGFLSIFRVSKNLGVGVGYSQLHQNEKDAKQSQKLNNTHDTSDTESE